MPEYFRRVRAFSPDLWRLLLAASILFTVWLGFLAVLYNLYLLRLGFDARTIGLLAGIGALVWGLAALPAGTVGNRIGLRNAILLGIVLFGLGIALTLRVEGLPQAQWQAWLLGCQVVTNVGIAFATVNAPPYMMAVSNDYERPHAFAFLAALNPLAAFLGSLVAGVLPGLLISMLPAGSQGMGLDQPTPYRLALWVGPIVAWLSAIPLLGANPGRTAAGPGERDSGEIDQGAAGTRSVIARAPWGLLGFWTLIIFLEAMSEGTLRTFFNVLLDQGFGASPSTIGLAMGVGQLLPILVALAVPLLITRWGAGYSLLSGIVALAACLIPFALVSQMGVQAHSLVGALVLIAIPYLAATATFSVIRASRNLYSQEMVIPRWRTNSQGATTLGLAFGLSAIGIAGGILIEAYGFNTLFLAGAMAGLASAAALLAFLQREARRRTGRALAGRSA